MELYRRREEKGDILFRQAHVYMLVRSVVVVFEFRWFIIHSRVSSTDCNCV